MGVCCFKDDDDYSAISDKQPPSLMLVCDESDLNSSRPSTMNHSLSINASKSILPLKLPSIDEESSELI